MEREVWPWLLEKTHAMPLGMTFLSLSFKMTQTTCKSPTIRAQILLAHNPKGLFNTGLQSFTDFR